MFWKIVLIIYIIITILAFGLVLLSIFEGAHKLNRLRPNRRKCQGDKVVFFSALLRCLILCALPIYHIILLIVCIATYDDTVNKAVDTAIHDSQEEEEQNV